MSNLDKVQIRCTAITNDIVIARFGKDPKTSLEQRDAQSEFWAALLKFCFPEGVPDVGQAVRVQFGGGDEQFECVVKRILSEESDR